MEGLVYRNIHARFLAPLVKARGFGMTPFRIRATQTDYPGGIGRAIVLSNLAILQYPHPLIRLHP